MNDFDLYLAQVGEFALKRRPMTASELMGLIQGVGLPIALLLLLIASSPR